MAGRGAAPAPTYLDLVIADGATALWKFDEASGTVADDAIGSADLTVAGSGVTYRATGPIPTVLPYAMSGSGIELATRASAALSNGAITIEALIYPTAGAYGVFQQGNDYFNSGLYMWTGGGLGLFFNVGINSGTRAQLASSGTVPSNQWVHIVGRYTGSEVACFINGAKTTTSYSSGFTSAGPLYVGGGTWAGIELQGRMGAAAIYNGVALTDVQVAAHQAAAGL